MPSIRTILVTAAIALVAVAVVNRVPMGRALLNGPAAKA